MSGELITQIITGIVAALGGVLTTVFAFRNEKKKVDTDSKTAASDDALKVVRGALDISKEIQDSLKKELAAMQDDIKHLEQQCDIVLKKNRELLDENEKLRDMVNMQSRQIGQLTDENATLKQDISSFMEKVTAVEMKVDQRGGEEK